MLEDDECMESQERFRAFFKGIAFIPDENGTCINGFQVNDSSFCITLYYHELKEKPTEQTLVFNASTSLNYTKVEHDRTNTPLENLKAGTDYELPSSESEHQVYLQGLTGMYINVEFPYLNNLNQTGRLVSIESAVLKLYPIKGTYNGKYPLPKSLSLYTADQNNATQSKSLLTSREIPCKREVWWKIMSIMKILTIRLISPRLFRIIWGRRGEP